MSSLDQWQKGLLPYMKYMLFGFALFFFASSIIQLFYLHNKMDFKSEIKLSHERSGSLPKDKETLQWNTISELEKHALLRRYHQANVSLMSGIWIKYLGFLTGMIIALTGAVFILGKINVDRSEISGENPITGAFSLKSSSPGLFLALMGVMLMGYTANLKTEIEVKDGAAYIPSYFLDESQSGNTQTAEEQLTEAQRNPETDPLPEDPVIEENEDSTSTQ